MNHRQVFLIVICILLQIVWCLSIALKTDKDDVLLNKDLWNRKHIRSKRYLGLSKTYKLNRRYQECVAPGDVNGHCKHLAYCPLNIRQINTLEYLCVIEKTFVGICCPDDILSSGVAGSQVVVDLPAGAFDYDENDNHTGCGIPAEGRSVSTTKTASIQEWPWMAALYRPKQLEQGVEQQFCGGALITDSHILTASHCTRGLAAADIRVRLGEYDFGKDHETRSRDHAVAQIIEHEDFVLATYENDIAILRLEKPTSFNTYIWPICLAPANMNFEDKTVTVAGWGQQYFAGPISKVLLHVSVPVWNHGKCVDAFVQRITDDNICAAGYDGGKDSCLGDSGGPLMYQVDNGRWITIGVVSWGIGCGNKGSPGVYTKVGNYLPWIIRHTMAKSEGANLS